MEIEAVQLSIGKRLSRVLVALLITDVNLILAHVILPFETFDVRRFA